MPQRRSLQRLRIEPHPTPRRARPRGAPCRVATPRFRVLDSAAAMRADRACPARLGGILAERSQPGEVDCLAERSQQGQVDGPAERSQLAARSPHGAQRNAGRSCRAAMSPGFRFAHPGYGNARCDGKNLGRVEPRTGCQFSIRINMHWRVCFARSKRNPTDTVRCLGGTKPTGVTGGTKPTASPGVWAERTQRSQPMH